MEKQRDRKGIVVAKKEITEEPNKSLQLAATLKTKLKRKLEGELKTNA